MRKGELKNRLRRRTADKLYDLDRSTGRMPAQLPAGELPAPSGDVIRRGKRPRLRRQPDPVSTG